jgi:hypothetical protein
MKIESSDIGRFWAAWNLWQTQEHGDPAKLASVMQTEYLDKGTDGLKSFVPGHLVSAAALAENILADPGYYREIRTVTESFSGDTAALVKICKSMQAIYPATMVPTVYLVMGRRTSGGSSTSAGLVIGAEMFSRRMSSRAHPEDFIPVVTHELVHYQQVGNKRHPGQTPSLLRMAMLEGAADFMAERLAGRGTNEAAKAYADAHEEELWRSFRAEMIGTDARNWLYNQGEVKGATPPDLGYYEGYKICQAFFESQHDKVLALRRIMAMEDERAILAESHYADRFR